jgi:glycerol-3-phosphate dehydrogenase (NAD(P)+)
MTDVSVEPVGVLGAGSWGTALAFLVARSGRDVVLWSAEAGHAERMATDRINERYLPGLRLESRIHPTESL